jgi:hypothetical protein
MQKRSLPARSAKNAVARTANNVHVDFDFDDILDVHN